MVNVGDPAPDLVCTEVLLPAGAAWTAAAFRGDVRIVFFWNNDPRDGDPSIATYWNKTADQFAGQPVEFVWITQLLNAPLKAWLVTPDRRDVESLGACEIIGTV